LGDEAGALVTHDERSWEGDSAIDDTHIAVAYAGVDDLHCHFARTGFAHLQAFHEPWLFSVEHDSSHADPFVQCPQ
jgi:hypothetical protein